MKKRLLAVGLALSIVALVQPYRPFFVSGDSMSPTLASGQVLLAKTHPHDLTRGDVVIFRHEGETLVKRIAYLPGDSIRRFWFVGEWKIPTSEAMLKSMVRRGLKSETLTIPQGHVYVLADNPYGSIDSRTLGPIPSNEITAIVPNVDSSAEWSIDGAHQGSALFARL